MENDKLKLEDLLEDATLNENSSQFEYVAVIGAGIMGQGIAQTIAAAGIETIILAQKDRSFVAVGDLAVVKLLVKKTDVEDALSVINDIKNKGTEPDLENDDLEN